jgi:hypothetical protein
METTYRYNSYWVWQKTTDGWKADRVATLIHSTEHWDCPLPSEGTSLIWRW